MRVIWISVLVILLDQLSKYALQFVPPEQGISVGPAWLSLNILGQSTLSVQQLTTALHNSTSWVLFAGLLAIYLLLTHWSTHLHFPAPRAIFGLQLIAGGIFSYTIDYLLRGTIVNCAQLLLPNGFPLNTGVADLSLLGGCLLLFTLRRRGTSRLGSSITLLSAIPTPLDMERMARGIDNIHIDIHLSPEFCRNASIIVHQQVDELFEAAKQQQRQIRPLPHSLLAPLKLAFHPLHQETLRSAKGSGESQLIDLFHVAVMKYIHQEVTNCVAARVRQAKETIQEHHKHGIGGTNDNQHIEHLFRHQERVIASVNQLMLRGLIDGEVKNLHKGIRGFLGKKSSFALEALQAPLVTANVTDSNDILFEHYLLFGRGRHRDMSFLQFDRVIDDLLHSYLRLIASDTQHSENITLHNRELASSDTTAEILSRPSVLAHPANITILFDQQWTREKIAKTDHFKRWGKYHKFRSHLRFQQQLADRAVYLLQKAKLANWVVVLYETRNLLAHAGSDISPARLVSLMVECDNRRLLQQRLETIYRQLKNPPDLNKVLETWERIQHKEEVLLRGHLHAFFGDFSRYRRDLQLLYRYHIASSQVSLLQDKRALQSSRANYTLYEFLLPTERERSQKSIRSHLIIKADLRGSTEVTDRLNQLALNPATHFERHFFSPINEVIVSFGAEKVFIEGDAIILVINNYAGTQQNQLTASRACGLAAAILGVVARQNSELACYGLPQLELGIGIAYSKEPPRFIFDGDHKITISPAINRADRLSACAWSVRHWREHQHAPQTEVEVYHPSERALGHGEKAQKDLVYNLNGILIEPEVFELLQQELSPKRIANNLPGKLESSLYAIKVPGSGSESTSLIIRKAPVKLYDPAYLLEECPIIEGRYFYEVIHKQEIIDALRNQTRSNEA